MKIDIVIVNWNTGNYLKECVLSLIEFNNGNINSIIIVDNNSTDNSLKDLPSKDFIKLIEEKKKKNIYVGDIATCYEIIDTRSDKNNFFYIRVLDSID